METREQAPIASAMTVSTFPKITPQRWLPGSNLEAALKAARLSGLREHAVKTTNNYRPQGRFGVWISRVPVLFPEFELDK
jgi:hypothetical protein